MDGNIVILVFLIFYFPLRSRHVYWTRSPTERRQSGPDWGLVWTPKLKALFFMAARDLSGSLVSSPVSCSTRITWHRLQGPDTSNFTPPVRLQVSSKEQKSYCETHPFNQEYFKFFTGNVSKFSQFYPHHSPLLPQTNL